MQGLRYTSRGLRRRNNTDKREVTLSHVGPVTGETARTFHTVGAKTKKGAEKARDALIFGLGSGSGAVGYSMTVRELMEQSLRYKEASGTIEPSTVRSYRGELPGARERLDDARHLRRRGPGREGGGGVEGGGQLRFGRVRARPHSRRGTRPAPEGARARHLVHGRAARGHARRRQGQGGRP